MFSEVYGKISDTRKEIRGLRSELNTIRRVKRELKRLQNKRDRLAKALRIETGTYWEGE